MGIKGLFNESSYIKEITDLKKKIRDLEIDLCDSKQALRKLEPLKNSKHEIKLEDIVCGATFKIINNVGDRIIVTKEGKYSIHDLWSSGRIGDITKSGWVDTKEELLEYVKRNLYFKVVK